jgi:hypothetical protein
LPVFLEANLSYPFEGAGVNSAVHPNRLLDRRRWLSFFQSSRSFHYVFTFPLESRLNFAFTPTQFGLRNNIRLMTENSKLKPESRLFGTFGHFVI